jgi:hypothetical protein
MSINNAAIVIRTSESNCVKAEGPGDRPLNFLAARDTRSEKVIRSPQAEGQSKRVKVMGVGTVAESGERHDD